ncbi:MAG: lipoprotein signal peptidase [Gammaproteobacteria bacterium]|nr:lipoprotein signal peptidase [Gammaproteobacteria bacterium]
MPEENAPRAAERIAWGRWLLVSLLVIVLDQWTKFEITATLELYQRVPVLPFFDIVRLHNPGAAFSFLADASGWQNGFFVAVAVAVTAGLLWWLAQLPARGKAVLALGLVLLIGGAVGNLADRLLHGYVVDFLLLYYGSWAFPAFNLADSAITCGVALVLFDGFVLERRSAAPAA